MRPPLGEVKTRMGACPDKKATSSSNVFEAVASGGLAGGMAGFAALLGAAGDWQESTSAPAQTSNAPLNRPQRMARP